MSFFVFEDRYSKGCNILKKMKFSCTFYSLRLIRIKLGVREGNAFERDLFLFLQADVLRRKLQIKIS
jgi:hypothetical protein